MEYKIKALVEELKKAGQEKFSVTAKREEDPEAKINVWYVIAKLEEALLEVEKGKHK